ncbi:hypothetical protein DFJ73DRAFT_967964 [Zopfochytrium polystomum]|nr:hypothetical protein DFJ73DRAFT_967964 [Zopfochytrium polystomum]
MCLVRRDRQQLAGADFLRAVDGGGGDGVEPWRSTLEEAVVFILERSGGGDAANALSLGGKTALDIALEVHAYWRRAGPWGAWEPGAYFGDPGSGAQKKSPAAPRRAARACDRGAGGARRARAAGWRRPASCFSARNFRGLSPLPLALDLVVANALAPRRERVDAARRGRGAGARSREGGESDDSDVDDGKRAATATTRATTPRPPALETPTTRRAASTVPQAVARSSSTPGGPRRLAELFLHDDDDDDGFWDRDPRAQLLRLGAVPRGPAVGALDRVLSRLDGAQRERCLASRALGDAVVARAEGDEGLSEKPMGGGGGAAKEGA